MTYTNRELREFANALEDTGNFRVLRRLALKLGQVGDRAGLKKAVFTDTETTGLDTQTCKIIEICAVAVAYTDHEGLLGFYPGNFSYHGFNDPQEPLSRDVKQVTGLTDEDVRGKRLDPERLARIYAGANIVIAHNAGFDRPIIERNIPQVDPNLEWACTATDLPWKEWGSPSASLGNIAGFLGYFFEAHRAINDVMALIHLMMLPPSGIASTPQFFGRLLMEAARPSYLIMAYGSNYNTKDILKARGYKWDPKESVWHTTIRDNTHEHGQQSPVDAEMDYLKGTIKCRPTVTVQTAANRFKS